jgi:hypothetical protein
MRWNSVWLIAAPALVLSSLVRAHHSQAMFDMSQCRTTSGTVRTLQYQFPHSWLWLNVSNANGQTDVWAFEFAAPAQMHAVDARWNAKLVKAGDKVTVRYSPTRNGKPAGAMFSLKIPDGSELRAATPACAQYGPPPIQRSRK